VEWIEVSVSVDSETAEAVAEVLSRYVHNGVVIEAGPDRTVSGPVVVRGYLPSDDRARATTRSVREALWHLGRIRPIPLPLFAPIADTDWTKAWREKLNVLHIGQRIVVRPTWREYAPMQGEVVITLDPGQAFGTGLHPTTQLSLAAIEELVRPGASVLDIGTGSGILAIAAAKIGAGRVVALDSDPVAVDAARRNVAANRVADKTVVSEGSLAEVTGLYDVVVVNIVLRTILELLKHGLLAHAKPGGHLVLAGILVEQEGAVLHAAACEGLGLVGRRTSDDWLCLILSKKP
jgi:ribosomal protein L11 methyltransferase